MIWNLRISTVVIHSELMTGVVVKEKGKLSVLEQTVRPEKLGPYSDKEQKACCKRRLYDQNVCKP